MEGRASTPRLLLGYPIASHIRSKSCDLAHCPQIKCCLLKKFYSLRQGTSRRDFVMGLLLLLGHALSTSSFPPTPFSFSSQNSLSYPKMTSK